MLTYTSKQNNSVIKPYRCRALGYISIGIQSESDTPRLPDSRAWHRSLTPVVTTHVIIILAIKVPRPPWFLRPSGTSNNGSQSVVVEVARTRAFCILIFIPIGYNGARCHPIYFVCQWNNERYRVSSFSSVISFCEHLFVFLFWALFCTLTSCHHSTSVLLRRPPINIVPGLEVGNKNGRFTNDPISFCAPTIPTKTLYLSPHTHIHSTSFRAVHCTFYREKGKTKTPRSESILSLNECVLSYKNSAISGQYGRQDNGQDEELQQQSIAEQQQHHQPTSVVSDRCR